MGSSETLDVKVTYTKVFQGDKILLCSDGLYNMVSEPEILETANQESVLADKCKALIEKGNAHGGTDNITVVMAEFSGPGLAPADTTAPVACKEFNEEDFKPRT